MALKNILVAVLLGFFITWGHAQEKGKKELRAEKKMERRQQTEELVNSKSFVFVARTALAPSGRSISLASNANFVKFEPELIDGDMPFFGRVYSGVRYAGDSGLTFKEKPEVFTIKKDKKKFQVNTIVKGENDRFQLSLYVGFEGSSTLTVISTNRSSMTYQGTISAPQPKAENQPCEILGKLILL